VSFVHPERFERTTEQRNERTIERKSDEAMKQLRKMLIQMYPLELSALSLSLRLNQQIN
jgi:hypothetical protein